MFSRIKEHWREIIVHFLAGVAVGCLGLFSVWMLLSTLMGVFVGR